MYNGHINLLAPSTTTLQRRNLKLPASMAGGWWGLWQQGEYFCSVWLVMKFSQGALNFNFKDCHTNSHRELFPLVKPRLVCTCQSDYLKWWWYHKWWYYHVRTDWLIIHGHATPPPKKPRAGWKENMQLSHTQVVLHDKNIRTLWQVTDWLGKLSAPLFPHGPIGLPELVAKTWLPHAVLVCSIFNSLSHWLFMLVIQLTKWSGCPLMGHGATCTQNQLHHGTCMDGMFLIFPSLGTSPFTKMEGSGITAILDLYWLSRNLTLSQTSIWGGGHNCACSIVSKQIIRNVYL